MNVNKSVIIFVLIYLSISVVLTIRVEELRDISLEKTEYTKILESAVDDGVFHLIELDKNRNFALLKENAAEQFFTSLSSGFGILGNKSKEETLQLYIPVILITDIDGFYIYYSEKITGKEVFLKKNWSEKYFFSFEEGEYIYYFTFGTGIKIFDKATGIVYEGNYKEIDLPTAALLQDYERYELTRRNTIMNKVQEKILYYINNHNRIAQEYGIQYHFWLPEIDTDDWYRTIDDIGMMVIFQGYPYGKSYETFNRYSFSVARIRKSNQYYIIEKSNIKSYHKEGCKEINQKDIVFYSPEECALQGAFPCVECFY